MWRKLGTIAFILSLIGFGVLGYLEVSQRLAQMEMKSIWRDTEDPARKQDGRGEQEKGKEDEENGFRPLKVEKRGPGKNQLGVLSVPKIGLEQVVLYDSTPENLRSGPSLMKETEYPGLAGNAVIAGHRTTYGFPFRRLNELKKGNLITFKNRSGKVTYRVSKVFRVDPNDRSVLDPADNARITLLTCDPPFASTYRLIVVGDVVSKN